MYGIDELSDLFRRSPIALYRTGPSGALLAANSALANLLGYDDLEGLRRGVSDVTSVYVDGSQRQQWLDHMAVMGVVSDLDVEFRRPDGTTMWVQDTARAIYDENGKTLYFEGALIDVTDKIRARKAKDEFLATVSHELRNPIAVVFGLSEELASNYETFTDEDRKDMARLIARQADDASWLIEDLLVAYRDDVSRLPMTIQDIDIVKEAERVLEVVDHPVALQVRGEDTQVRGDPRRLRQIVRNLVSNAIRYGGEEVVITLEPIGDRMELRVCDSGPGIGPDDIEKIFKAFETGAAAPHPGSVGLGLPVARKLARLMEGDLVYRHIDEMSCFVLSLPTA